MLCALIKGAMGQIRAEAERAKMQARKSASSFFMCKILLLFNLSADQPDCLMLSSIQRIYTTDYSRKTQKMEKISVYRFLRCKTVHSTQPIAAPQVFSSRSSVSLTPQPRTNCAVSMNSDSKNPSATQAKKDVPRRRRYKPSGINHAILPKNR